jgi:hypothetical protein
MIKNVIRFWLFLTVLLPAMLFAQTTFSVDPTKGYWTVSSGIQSLPRITSSLNGQNILLHAKKGKSGYCLSVDGLEVTSGFEMVNGQWAELSVSVLKNKI